MLPDNHRQDPVFGARRPAVLRVARETGLAPVMWNVTGYDWNAPPSAEIERKVARQIEEERQTSAHLQTLQAQMANHRSMLRERCLLDRLRMVGQRAPSIEGIDRDNEILDLMRARHEHVG